ncbi:MAG: hypothetical protein NT124_04360 [Candidatus Dependentiae bacterium]|nr:hypothetical protein [Candidatus Dependentiae bacterium]
MKELGFECCFCGESIESNKTDPCDINVLINIDKQKDKQYNQTFYCHLMCFKKVITSRVPLYLEHLVSE